MREEIEQALREHLAQVKAPEELWGRVHGAKPHGAVPRFSTGWAWVAASVVVTVIGWSQFHSAARLNLDSHDPAEVRSWVLAHSGLDVPLPAQPSSLVEILGASIDRAGDLIARIRYRVGEIQATLSVTKLAGEDPGGKRHQDSEVSSTWAMGGQSYTLALAGPGELRTACLLCHSAHEAALY